MKFYFCEGCGRRITDAEIASGEGRDKKLKGVFCKECAVGVTTMDSLPVSDSEARRLVAKEDQKRPARRRTSASKIPAARKRSSTRLSATTVPDTTKGRSNAAVRIRVFAAIGMAVALGVGVTWLALGRNPASTKKNVNGVKKVAAKPVEKRREDGGAVSDQSNKPDNGTKDASHIESVASQPEPPTPSIEELELDPGGLDGPDPSGDNKRQDFDTPKPVPATATDPKRPSPDVAHRHVFRNGLDGVLQAVKATDFMKASARAKDMAGHDKLKDWAKAARVLPGFGKCGVLHLGVPFVPGRFQFPDDLRVHCRQLGLLADIIAKIVQLKAGAGLNQPPIATHRIGLAPSLAGRINARAETTPSFLSCNPHVIAIRRS